MSMTQMFNACMFFPYIIPVSMHLIDIDLPWFACVTIHLTYDEFVYVIVLDILITKYFNRQGYEARMIGRAYRLSII